MIILDFRIPESLAAYREDKASTGPSHPGTAEEQQHISDIPLVELVRGQCSNVPCRNPVRSIGPCHTCYEYRRKNGMVRPKECIEKARKNQELRRELEHTFVRRADGLCSNAPCSEPAISLGLCNACGSYRRAHPGKDRPKNLIERPKKKLRRERG
jgi:hypothetical protein